MRPTIEIMCEDIFARLIKTNNFSLKGNRWTGHEILPTLSHNHFTLSMIWKNRNRKTIDGIVYYDGNKIFDFEVQLETFSKIDGKRSRELGIKVHPGRNNYLLLVLLGYDHTNIRSNPIEIFNTLFTPDEIDTVIEFR